jgi:hypothetical protein
VVQIPTIPGVQGTAERIDEPAALQGGRSGFAPRDAHSSNEAAGCGPTASIPIRPCLNLSRWRYQRVIKEQPTMGAPGRYPLHLGSERYGQQVSFSEEEWLIVYTGFQTLAESLRCTIQQGQGGNGLRSQPRHRPAEETLPSDGQCNAAPCYSLNATPLNGATPVALDVATWVKSP